MKQTLALMDEAGSCGFDITRALLKKFDFQKGFFQELKKDIDISRLALSKALGTITGILKNFENEKNYSVFEKTTQSRVKNHHSIFSKLIRKEFTDARAYKQFDDLSGFRIIVKYISDAYEILNRINSSPQGSCIVKKIKDKIATPNDDGYRAIHVILEVPVENIGFKPRVEVQIRTGFQNAWATKTHELTYKNDHILEQFTAEFKAFSDLLYEADNKCVELKQKILKEVED
nr:hypothetical protein [Desulfobacter hydrogenophilus]